MMKIPSALRKNEVFSFFFGVCVSAFAMFFFLRTPRYSGSISIPMEEFPEPQWRTPATLAVRTITSTPFARFEIHKVKTGDVNDNDITDNDVDNNDNDSDNNSSDNDYSNDEINDINYDAKTIVKNLVKL